MTNCTAINLGNNPPSDDTLLHFTVSWFFWCCFSVGLLLCFSLEELKVLLVLGKLVVFSFVLQQRKEVRTCIQCASIAVPQFLFGYLQHFEAQPWTDSAVVSQGLEWCPELPVELLRPSGPAVRRFAPEALSY